MQNGTKVNVVLRVRKGNRGELLQRESKSASSEVENFSQKISTIYKVDILEGRRFGGASESNIYKFHVAFLPFLRQKSRINKNGVTKNHVYNVV